MREARAVSWMRTVRGVGLETRDGCGLIYGDLGPKACGVGTWHLAYIRQRVGRNARGKTHETWAATNETYHLRRWGRLGTIYLHTLSGKGQALSYTGRREKTEGSGGHGIEPLIHSDVIPMQIRHVAWEKTVQVYKKDHSQQLFLCRRL